jgi:hypothetical protein
MFARTASLEEREARATREDGGRKETVDEHVVFVTRTKPGPAVGCCCAYLPLQHD